MEASARQVAKVLRVSRQAVVPVPLSQPTAAVVSHAVQGDLQGSGTQLFGSVGHLTAEDACGQRRSEAGEPSSASHTLSCFRVTAAELDKGKTVVLCNHGLLKKELFFGKLFTSSQISVLHPCLIAPPSGICTSITEMKSFWFLIIYHIYN